MKQIISVLLLLTTLFAMAGDKGPKPPVLTPQQKLELREAQLRLASIKLAEQGATERYRAAAAVAENDLNRAFGEAQKSGGTTWFLNPNTLEFEVKPPDTEKPGPKGPPMAPSTPAPKQN